MRQILLSLILCGSVSADYPLRYACIVEYSIAREKVLGRKIVPAPPEPTPNPIKICPDCKNTGRVKSPEGFDIGPCTNPNCPVKPKVPIKPVEPAAKTLKWFPQNPNVVVVDGVSYTRKPPAVNSQYWKGAKAHTWTSKERFQICYGAWCRSFFFTGADNKTLMLLPEFYGDKK